MNIVSLYIIYVDVYRRKCIDVGAKAQMPDSSFLSIRRRYVVLNGKSSQEYSVNTGVPQCSILGPTLFLLYYFFSFLTGLLDDVTCNIAICADDTTLYSKFDQAF